MNCPSRPDTDAIVNGWNQNPNALQAATNNDSNGIANLRQQRGHWIEHELPLDTKGLGIAVTETESSSLSSSSGAKRRTIGYSERSVSTVEDVQSLNGGIPNIGAPASTSLGSGSRLEKSWAAVRRFAKFIGPGFMVAVAYIDPGNYSTDIAAGATYRFQLLVMVLFSNIIAIFLQSLSIRLGSVTGMNLAENIREHCPRWLNYVLYFMAESAIIATDIAEVIGTAIALNLLLRIPLVAGCAISIVDVVVLLIFYRPQGSMKGLRVFEFFVAALVLGVVVCFSIELSLITVPDIGTIFKGYLPSSALVQSEGLYQACGILGATVMPHSLYLGSGIVQPRLHEYDKEHGNLTSTSYASTPSSDTDSTDSPRYQPSLAAIKACMSYSIAELAVALFTFALFVNSAILIVAGASLSGLPDADTASLFSVYHLLSKSLAPAAGTVFALALLLSGTSAGIVCTIAGQMVSEGQLRWATRPWVRRLVTRSISITPSIIIAGAVGGPGLSAALNGTQVALSVILPFTSAPLIYFTCRNKFMTVVEEDDGPGEATRVHMRNGWIATGFAVAFWLLIVVMNVALLVLVGMGKT